MFFIGCYCESQIFKENTRQMMFGRLFILCHMDRSYPIFTPPHTNHGKGDSLGMCIVIVQVSCQFGWQLDGSKLLGVSNVFNSLDPTFLGIFGIKQSFFCNCFSVSICPIFLRFVFFFANFAFFGGHIISFYPKFTNLQI